MGPLGSRQCERRSLNDANVETPVGVVAEAIESPSLDDARPPHTCFERRHRAERLALARAIAIAGDAKTFDDIPPQDAGSTPGARQSCYACEVGGERKTTVAPTGNRRVAGETSPTLASAQQLNVRSQRRTDRGARLSVSLFGSLRVRLSLTEIGSARSSKERN